MSYPRTEFEIWQDEIDEWRWRLRGENGEIVASSEGYVSRSNAERGARALVRLAAPHTETEIVFVEPKS